MCIRDRARAAADVRRGRPGAGGCVCADALFAEHAAGRDQHGRGYVFGRGDFALRGGAAGVLHTGAAGDARGPDGSAAPRVKATTGISPSYRWLPAYIRQRILKLRVFS